MERATAERKIKRRLFSLCLRKLEELLPTKDHTNISAEFQKLTKLYDELSTLQNKILNLWLDDENRDEKIIEKDVDTSDEYDTKWYIIKEKVKECLNIVEGSHKSSSIRGTIRDKNSISSEDSLDKQRRYRLPQLELPKFDGAVKSWITFWAQFRKIHMDEKIDDDDKFQYLLQCMERGSAARELVYSFPPSGNNYPKVIDQLKERFAKDEVIIEHYVRELLQLVLAQAKKSSKMSTRSLYDKLMTQIMALETMGVTQDKYAAFLLPLVESSLPEDILKAWHRSHFFSATEGSVLTRLLNFIKLEVETEERIRLAHTGFSEATCDSIPTASCFATSEKRDKRDYEQKNIHKNIATKNEKQCIWCDKITHASSECTVAVKMSLDERKEFIKKKNACYICLNIGHTWRTCRKHPKCVICMRRHFPILCSGFSKDSNSVENTKEKKDMTMMNQVTPMSSKTVLLQTLKVKIVANDRMVTVRALLDSGAQRSFIRSDVVKELNLKPFGQQEMRHVLFGGCQTEKIMHNVHILDVRNLEDTFGCKIEALQQDTICGRLPSLKKGSILFQLQSRGIFLTDCDNGDESDIQLLIGSDVLGNLHMGRSVHVSDDLLAVQTRLGWTLQGPVIGMFPCFDCLNILHCQFDLEDLWKLETIGIRDQPAVKSQSIVESEVVNFFKNTIIINKEERYEVQLPWKDTAKVLLPNYNLALKRLKSTTVRLDRLGILSRYDKVFEEWLQDGIIEKVDNDDSQGGHYIPHHAVVKEESLTTKIRPVFDASTLDRNGFSLNSCLEKGTNLIELIPTLLIQFRRNAIGITSDIKKAFLQISLNERDRNYLKFLWWQNVNDKKKVLQTYRHRRVVFGVTTSPFLLSATILHHLEKYSGDTCDKLRKSFYVDNCVVSTKNVEDMNRFIKESKEIMMDGKFELRCWVSGPVTIDESVRDSAVLGLIWDCKQDDLRCKIPSTKSFANKVTKRSILSIAQSVFDPIGFVCPTTIVPKLILQKCWLLNLGWDDELPEDLSKYMKEWVEQMPLIDLCRVPRCLSSFDIDNSRIALHVFSDASMSAYACCIFLRSEYEGQVNLQLVLAKSRVAPTRSITIPRLELIAALMATRLASEVKEGLELNCKEYYWTDSSITLAWIKKREGLNIFVYNRVKEIVQRTNVEDWRHIPGPLNPADLPSRGCNPKRLLDSQWWNGPRWLREQESNWPKSEQPYDVEEFQKEVKNICLITLQSDKFSDSLAYFSKYSKVVRMIGWCLRFVRNCHRHIMTSHEVQGDLSAREYKEAEKCFLKILQREDDIEKISKKSKLETVCDADGLLRVKTRLVLSKDTDGFITPIILSGKNKFVESLVFQKHTQDLHVGSQTLTNSLREDYWILGIRRLARKVVRQCITCKRYSGRSCDVPPAPLPFNRVHCGAIFEVTGIDFAGPLYLRSGDKSWIVVFTCATYRAVHLELCTSLSTEDFLLALRRFFARRGRVKVIYSDNGTNLRGASNLFNSIDWQEVERSTNVQKIEWRFIPPAAPWWGGFWERMIRTLKDILRRVLGKASLRYQEMTTVLCEVEAIVNARPLTYMAESTENLKPLTPLMFLRIDNPVSDIPEINLVNGDLLSSRWKYLKKLSTDLKNRFRSEYLSLLAQKQRKISNNHEIKVGDVVLIGCDNIKRCSWPLGLVLELYPGVDGHSRVARLRTNTGERVRPLQRLYPLEVPSSNFRLPQSDQEISMAPPSFDDTALKPGVPYSGQLLTRAGRPIKKPCRLGF